jgi:heavy metal translocating P-type ATPase
MTMQAPGSRLQTSIALLAVVGIAVHLALRWSSASEWAVWPLLVVLTLGGIPLLLDLGEKLVRGVFGSDLLAGISIVTSVILGEYLAGSLVVLMLSGGEALEAYAVRNASSVLAALAQRMPSVAHRRAASNQLEEVSLASVRIGDTLVVFPHEICPVDGTVIEGHGIMDESYLTGEPYRISKAPGATVLSGAINGDTALAIRADRLPEDSRYARIMQVMRESEQSRPRLRRLGDQLGALYTPVAVALGLLAWTLSGEPVRFLAVLVVATPCPLLIAIPVAIIGAISLAARRGIIIKDPSVLETIDTCRTAIFDKTGTLTYGQPEVVAVEVSPQHQIHQVLRLVASLERYSKHPLAAALLERASREPGLGDLPMAQEVREPPGEGLKGRVEGHRVEVTSRKKLLHVHPELEPMLPPMQSGLECVVLIDDQYAATIRFRDRPRAEGAAFIHHLGPRHQFRRVLIVSGDRESEVRYLAEQVGITEIHAGQTPEQKLAIVQAESAQARTVFLGDGINDAPALTAATVGVAFGQNSDITTEAAGAIIMDSSLRKVDEFLHISQRLRAIALQSALGGMAASVVGMILAALGYLPPVMGAVVQEVIDVVVVVNALRMALPPGSLTDY